METSLSCFEILFAIQTLYFLETYAFAALLTVKPGGWNLLVKLSDKMIYLL